VTRFIYIADTHLGGDPEGYHQQPRYTGSVPELLRALDEWIERDGSIDFVLHGGDMVERTDVAVIRQAVEQFSLSVPVYLCLGNHDVTAPDAVQRWLAEAPGLFPDASPDFAVVRDDLLVYVMPNHWGDEPYYWEERQDPWLLDSQIDELEKCLAHCADRTCIVATHSPVMAVPAAQTGLDEDYHLVPDAFVQRMLALAERHPQVRCVLSAHSHINTHVERSGVHFVTATSLIESPFEFKLVELEPGVLRVSTVALAPNVDFRPEYDFDKTYVQGRPRDRGFEAATAP
jgi:hypothetical protein